MDLQQRLQNIQMILTDVDGVLTDGALIFDGKGTEIKCFHARDGLGTRIWLDKGYKMGFVTRRETEVVRHRAEELKIQELFQGAAHKSDHLAPVCEKYGLMPEQIAYVGDDWVDYDIMRRVGLAACPSDAVDEIREISHLVTRVPGGKGVVREVIEQILKSRNEWNNFGF